LSNQTEFNVYFTDVTLQQADGDFAEVKQMVESEFPYPEYWMLDSIITIDSQFGLATFSLHFFSDRKVKITKYNPSVGKVYYNPDIGALSEWLQCAGWHVPEPDELLVRENTGFWKHYWDTLLIDSDFFDKIYGVREHADPEWIGNFEDDEEGDNEED
jgi:hypothetical protein